MSSLDSPFWTIILNFTLSLKIYTDFALQRLSTHRWENDVWNFKAYSNMKTCHLNKPDRYLYSNSVTYLSWLSLVIVLIFCSRWLLYFSRKSSHAINGLLVAGY